MLINKRVTSKELVGKCLFYLHEEILFDCHYILARNTIVIKYFLTQETWNYIVDDFGIILSVLKG